ncbi:hypothetical protein B0H15DRAFT_907642 [Mycena belliarum]|uniref:Uncharacterized protein n=1 Tax=Mycena belliarum TaxID=1033014 RepID=A0AAD6U5M2_9AGAR|nr:hypothetical protein B0H15DRAFT_907642 [Mycena belliae]
MSASRSDITVGSLYIAGFTQARAPHVGLIVPTDSKTGCLVHIRIDKDKFPNWMHQHRTQAIANDMFLSSLLKIHDVSAGEITPEQLRAAAAEIPAPDNDEFGECGPWVYRVVQQLQNVGLVVCTDLKGMAEEFEAFAAGNRAYARRDRLPNVAVSQFCT